MTNVIKLVNISSLVNVSSHKHHILVSRYLCLISSKLLSLTSAVKQQIIERTGVVNFHFCISSVI